MSTEQVTSESNVLFTLHGVPVTKVTCKRIKPEERIEGRHYYCVRHADENWGEPCSLEKFVMVNYYCGVETLEPIEVLETDNEKSDKWLELSDDDKQNIFDNE